MDGCKSKIMTKHMPIKHPALVLIIDYCNQVIFAFIYLIFFLIIIFLNYYFFHVIFKSNKLLKYDFCEYFILRYFTYICTDYNCSTQKTSIQIYHQMMILPEFTDMKISPFTISDLCLEILFMLFFP